MIKVHDTYDYRTVFTDKDAKIFAALTDDFNPIHIDKKFAAESEFGRPVAQGVLILCAFTKVFGTLWPGDRFSYFISQNITYLKPVYINEPYSIKFECTNIDYKRMIGTISGHLKDSEGNDVVITEARICSKTQFSSPTL